MLKEREQKILDYMKEEIREKGYPPTVREICSALHIKSTSTAHKDIDSLVKKGFIVKDPSKPRALMLVDQDEPNLTPEPHIDNAQRTDIVDIPVVGHRCRNANLGRAEYRGFLSHTFPFFRQQHELHAGCKGRKYDRSGNHGR